MAEQSSQNQVSSESKATLQVPVQGEVLCGS